MSGRNQDSIWLYFERINSSPGVIKHLFIILFYNLNIICIKIK